MELLANGAGDIIFFRDRDGPPVPTLKQLHKYPFLLKPQQVDKGAIRFILSGANIMCPGLTSPGANMIDAEANEIVAIYAEGETSHRHFFSSDSLGSQSSPTTSS